MNSRCPTRVEDVQPVQVPPFQVSHGDSEIRVHYWPRTSDPTILRFQEPSTDADAWQLVSYMNTAHGVRYRVSSSDGHAPDLALVPDDLQAVLTGYLGELANPATADPDLDPLELLEDAADDAPLKTRAAVEIVEKTTNQPHQIRRALDRARRRGLVESAGGTEVKR